MATRASKPIDVGAVQRKRRPEWRSALYYMLHGFGFVGTTLLLTWGLFVLFFLAIGGFSLDGMVRHLHNLTSRYLAADAARTTAFILVVAIAHLILSTAVIVLRRDKIRPEGTREGAR